ncbi:MAG: acetylglutamate kinase [Huintestinicola sp.]
MRRPCFCSPAEIGKEIRKLWSQHVYWTRMFIISTAEELEDLEYVTGRLLDNPADFARVLKRSYGAEKAAEFEKLFTEHLQIGGELVNAEKDQDTKKADVLRRKWYANADAVARFLAGINPFWRKGAWRSMMYSHLSMTEKEAAYRLKKEYPKDIKAFDAIEKEAMEMADYMSSGIAMQFSCR